MNTTRALALLSALALALCATACSRSGSTNVPDPTKKSVITLRSSIAEPNGITIKITGKIDGSAVVHADNWEKVSISGEVEWQIYKDWFEPSCDIHYEPSGVTTGSLTIDYTFH